MQVHCVDEEYAVEAQRTAARCVMVSSEATLQGGTGKMCWNLQWGQLSSPCATADSAHCTWHNRLHGSFLGLAAAAALLPCTAVSQNTHKLCDAE